MRQPSFDLSIRCDYFLSMARGEARVERDIFLGIKNGKVAKIAPWKGKVPSKRFIDARNKVVLPGLINGHTHLAMTLFRGLEDDEPLQKWLFDTIVPLEAVFVTRDFVRTGTELAALESIRFGVTTVCDMYFYAETVAGVLDRAGMRGIVGQVWLSHPMPEDRELGTDKAGLFKKLYRKYSSHERVMPALAPHAAYTCSDEALKEVAALARQYAVPIHIHLNETDRESDVEKLDHLGVLGPRTICAHCVHLTEKEFEILKRSGAAVVSNPDSNLKLSSGVAPVSKFLNQGIRVAWGTDGSASNNDLSIFGAMDVGTKLQKMITKDNTSMVAEQALRCATWGGAAALGLEGKVGSLEVGKDADVTIVDLNFPHMQPVHNLVSQLVYSAQGLEVDTVLCRGQVLLKNKKFCTLKPEPILKRAQVYRNRIRKWLNER